MFEYSLTHWVTFFTAAILLNLSPGPDMAFILAQTARRGRRFGFCAMFGIWTGALVHALFAALGLSTILATSAVAFTAVKWLGAAYLVWLGIQALRSKGGGISSTYQASSKSFSQIYKQGVFVAILNPKVALFFLAFLPQFVEKGAGPVSAQLFLHGFLIIVVAAFIEPPLILIGSKLTGYLSRNKYVASWMDRSLGALFLWLGFKLFTSDRI